MENIDALDLPGPIANPLKKYLLATRPQFLLASLVPALLGIATAYHGGAAFSLSTALLTVFGAMLCHAAANVFNDYYDALNGTDAANVDRLYPFTGGSRFIQNGLLSEAQTRNFALSLTVAGIVVGVLLLMRGGAALVAIGMIGLFIGWAYSAPPFALNSRGLGELSIAVAFGLLIVSGSDLVQRGFWSAEPLWLAIPSGLLTSSLLYINQFPDRLADAQAGKRHWVVRLGAERARWGYWLLIVVANLWLLGLVLVGMVPPLALIALLPALLSLAAAKRLWRYSHGGEGLVAGIKMTIAATLLHGLLLAGALVLSA